SDIFAVGILAVEMLTGTRLFLGETDYQTVELVRRAEVPSLAALNPDVPPELEKIIRKALAKDLDVRYQKAGDFHDDLLGFLFSRSLKVSARMLSDVLEDLRKVQPALQPMAPDGSTLILQMIDDEFLAFRSLGEDEDAPETGSQPLESLMGGAVLDYDPHSPLALDRFESNDDDAPPQRAHSGRHEAVREEPNAPSARGPRAPTRMPSPAPRRETSMAPWIVLLLLLAAGGGAYYWLVVLGNLQLITG
ncbi:MAG: hypothetical protein IAG13_25235, partial [Deltaproteobacteria bacterium]|nr:hypothetical protein [Nannocystaceae bacterium]